MVNLLKLFSAGLFSTIWIEDSSNSNYIWFFSAEIFTNRTCYNTLNFVSIIMSKFCFNSRFSYFDRINNWSWFLFCIIKYLSHVFFFLFLVVSVRFFGCYSFGYTLSRESTFRSRAIDLKSIVDNYHHFIFAILLGFICWCDFVFVTVFNVIKT